MYQIGLKLWSVNTEHYYQEAAHLYAEGMFDYIELYVVPGSIAALPKWKEQKAPFIIHCPHFAHGFNLAKKEKESSNRTIYQEVKQFADQLHAKYIIFHGGIDGDPAETARQLAALNEPRALIENKPFIALPNRMGGNFCRGATYEELKMIISQAHCGFCLDFGHAVCSASSQHKDPYVFIQELCSLQPKMFHLSDVLDMTSAYDAHPHLGTGSLDIARLKRDILPPNAIISLETDKNSKENLNDFIGDVQCIRK